MSQRAVSRPGRIVRLTMDVSEAVVRDLDDIRNNIGVDRSAVIKIWLYERVQQEKAYMITASFRKESSLSWSNLTSCSPNTNFLPSIKSMEFCSVTARGNANFKDMRPFSCLHDREAYGCVSDQERRKNKDLSTCQNSLVRV